MLRPTSSGEVLINRGRRRKRTQAVITNGERLEGVRSRQHQIACQVCIFNVTRYRNLDEVEVISKVQQNTRDGTDPAPQVKGRGEPRGVQRSIPPIGHSVIRVEVAVQPVILGKGKGIDKVEDFSKRGEGFEEGQ